MAPPRAKLSDRVFAELRAGILSGRYRPGERLVEEKLSPEYGVSRVPMREAIKRLQAEGLASAAEDGRGAMVTSLSPEAVEELVEARAVLEGLNARFAARHRDSTMLARLREVLERGNAAAGHAGAEELVALNGAFHDLLYRAGSTKVLPDLIRPLRERTNLVFRLNSTERAEEDWREHAMILAAVVDGDEELAALLAARHVRRAARARMK
jgi:DNA-binding GntR family transcriptional regulator